jgi:aryl-alcohol dehydrogenase-like predicted oxidoreductase
MTLAEGESPLQAPRGEQDTYVQQYMTDSNYDKVEKLTAWAKTRGRNMNELAHAWLLARPQLCSVISGATKLDQVLSNARAADWVLAADEFEEVNGILSQ